MNDIATPHHDSRPHATPIPPAQCDLPHTPPTPTRRERGGFLVRLKRWLDEKHLWRAESAVIVGAALIGLFGAVLQHANQRAYATKLREQYRIVPIVVAASRVNAGTILRREHLTTAEILSGARTANMLEESELAKAIGKPVALNLGRGDPILLSSVASGTADGSVASRIPVGKRLFTLNVDDAASSNGFIRAGDFVDVLTTMDLPGRGSTTFTLLSRVQLTAVGRSLDASSQSESTQVSFLISPQEMEALKHAQAHGSFSLSLRNPNDKDATKPGKGVALQDLFLRDGIYEKAELPVEINEGARRPK